MALPAVVENLEEIPEIARDEYKPDADGKRFVREMVGAEGGDDLGALKRALEREKAERRKFARLAEERGGIDPEEYRALKTERETREREEAERKGQYEKVLTQRDEIAKRKQDELEQKAKAYWERLEKKFVQGDATSIAMRLGALDEAPEILMPHIERQTRLVEESDGMRVVVVDSHGEIRLSPKTGHEMTVEELIQEMRAGKFASLFRSSGATGGGAAASGVRAGGPKQISRASFDGLSPIEKTDFIKKGGQVADPN